MYTPIELKFKTDSLKGISEKQITTHYEKHYKSYVNGRNKIVDKLNNKDYSCMRQTKKLQSHNTSGQVLHEIYFEHLGGSGGKPSGQLLEQINKDFGSYEEWKNEFIECAKVARGWVLLCYDWSDNRLHNYIVDFHDEGACWKATPIFALDVWEHAYYLDYANEKMKYVDAFFDNINWTPIEEKIKQFQKK